MPRRPCQEARGRQTSPVMSSAPTKYPFSQEPLSPQQQHLIATPHISRSCIYRISTTHNTDPRRSKSDKSDKPSILPTRPNSNNPIVNIKISSAQVINSTSTLNVAPSESIQPSQPLNSPSISTPSISNITTSPSPKSNFPFGSLLSARKSPESIRFYFNNINGIRPYNDWTRWRSAIHTLFQLNVDIIGTAETNLDWTPASRNIARTTCQSFYQNAILTTSSSIDHAKTDFQPGGTLTTVTGKWTGRCFNTVTDKSGMGRWLGHSLQTSTNAVHILSAYRPVQGSNDAANHTLTLEHLARQGQPQP
jgi:hypothetical protein